jgi:uncharacterized protein (DUF1778 family)
MSKRNIRIVARVSDKEHAIIAKKAKASEQSISEYIRQRAVGYEPKAFPSDAYFILCEKIDNLIENPDSPKFKQEVIDCLDIISFELGR